MINLSQFLGNSWRLLVYGGIKTFMVWIMASFFALCIGFVWGIMRCNRMRIPYVSTCIDGITFLFRGIPFYIQLLISYFILPTVIGIPLSATTSAVIALSLCSAGYVSQIIRAGINAISVGQWEAAYVLGYSPYNTVCYVIAPQAFRIIVPALVGECDQLLKSTAVISAIGVLELTGAAKNIITQEMNPIAVYAVLACIYLSMSTLLALCTAWLEKRYSL